MSNAHQDSSKHIHYTHHDDQIRLMTRVARMYHDQGKRQSEIASTLRISQPRVSRLLKRAAEVGIVRVTVTSPVGVYTELEESLEQRFNIRQAVVTHVDSMDGDITPALGAATAEHLSSTLYGLDRIGISSWSASLLAVVRALSPFRAPVAENIVQLVGGLGDPRVQMQATRMIELLSNQTGAEPILLPTPGVVGSADAQETLMSDPVVHVVKEAWEHLTVALVGIGAIEPSALAKQSGNALPESDQKALAELGAVGDICFRFFDSQGAPVDSNIETRVIGISPDALLRIPRRIGVAGGHRKVAAVRGALMGGWINELVTDVGTAEELLKA